MVDLPQVHFLHISLTSQVVSKGYFNRPSFAIWCNRMFNIQHIWSHGTCIEHSILVKQIAMTWKQDTLVHPSNTWMSSTLSWSSVVESMMLNFTVKQSSTPAAWVAIITRQNVYKPKHGQTKTLTCRNVKTLIYCQLCPFYKFSTSICIKMCVEIEHCNSVQISIHHLHYLHSNEKCYWTTKIDTR